MAEQAKKPGFFARISRSFKDMKGELKKVVWPTKKQILNNTVVVLVFVAVCSVFIGALDFVFTQVLSLLVNFL